MNASNTAIIAGTGSLPIAAAASLYRTHTPFISICLFGEQSAMQLKQYGPVITQDVYKLGGIIATLKKHKVDQVLFIGKVDKRHLLKKVKYDWLFTKLMAKALFKNDSDVMQLLIEELNSHGIATISQREVLRELFVDPGTHAGMLTDALQSDITLGMRTAETLSQADIGQTVVVKNGMVLAVEAIEGTDECIARGITLGTDKVVVCKTARTTQSDKFDIPTLGPDTLDRMQTGSVAAVAWHAKRTMIADYDRFVQVARDKGIVLVAL